MQMANGWREVCVVSWLMTVSPQRIDPPTRTQGEGKRGHAFARYWAVRRIVPVHQVHTFSAQRPAPDLSLPVRQYSATLLPHRFQSQLTTARDDSSPNLIIVAARKIRSY